MSIPSAPTLVCSYARTTRSPVLTCHMMLVRSLRACYALSGTDLRCTAMRLRACDGTDLAYVATMCYAISGTDLAYAARPALRGTESQ
eukprot:1000565-Rhodomonas_salina.5